MKIIKNRITTAPLFVGRPMGYYLALKAYKGQGDSHLLELWEDVTDNLYPEDF